MGSRLLFTILALGFGAIGIWGFTSKTGDAVPRFEAHEFAIFRSQYDSLRVQNPAKRAEHFRDLLETSEIAVLTPAMAEALAAFCGSVVDSSDEAGVVKAEAKLVLRSLEKRHPNRAIAGAEKSPPDAE